MVWARVMTANHAMRAQSQLVAGINSMSPRLAMTISESGREGSGELGGWVEVANLRCLGEADTVYLEQLAAIVGKLDHFEARARERLLSEARGLLEDRVWSAYGQLRHGRLMAEDRARELLGTLRLGALTETIQEVSFQEITEIWMRVRDGRLQVDEALGDLERQERRAQILREWLAAPKA